MLARLFYKLAPYVGNLINKLSFCGWDGLGLIWAAMQENIFSGIEFNEDQYLPVLPHRGLT